MTHQSSTGISSEMQQCIDERTRILAATVLAVYKPWGMTPYGRRQRGTGVVREPESLASSSPWRLYLLLGWVSLILLLLVLHLLGGGPRAH